MRRIYFLFLDGVGLGEADSAVNPLVAAQQAGLLPTLDGLLNGTPLTHASGRVSTGAAELIPVDAQMGVPGRPQSATGQAALVSGVNASVRLGEHYGPRPDDRVRALLDEGTLFSRLRAAGLSTWFVNAYPEPYFAAIKRGKRLLSAIPYAVTQAGQALPTYEDLAAGRALSADFTGEGWRRELGYSDAPVYSPFAAGRSFARIGLAYSLTFFEHWLTDLLGHEQAHARAMDNFAVI
ncbi:MAG: metalloenzyme domain-containing protein, partial [Caldilineaceae bacterium]